MARFTRRMISALAISLFLPATGSWAASGATIGRVELHNEVTGAANGYPDLQRKSIGKFFGSELVSGQERFDVFWQPPVGGLKEGAAMILEYRRQYGEEVHGKTTKFTIPITISRKTSFIADDEAVTDGPISMWRVRLVRQGRLLAEMNSGTWE